MPEAIVLEGEQLALSSKIHQRLPFKTSRVAVDEINAGGGEHKKSTVDEASITAWLFGETGYDAALPLDRAVATGRSHRSDRRFAAMGAVEGDFGRHVNVCEAVAIGKAESRLILNMGSHALQPASGERFLAGVNKCDFPRLGFALMDLHAVCAHVDRHIGHVEEVVRKVFLDHISFVAAADHELIHAVSGINLHDVP